jgi:pimeloyl-ACP methyl ester carboxylesterase
MRLRNPLLLLTLALAASLRAAGADFTVERGEIDGAKFMVAAPAEWNGRVLLLAHGLRPEDQPLHAELYETTPPVSTLLDRHWLVALTSYRRNGLVLRDAMTDLDHLRTHLAKKYGAPKRVYLMGESMGGAIVTSLMETKAADYAGAVAIGAALQVESMEPGFAFTRQPRGPILFLTNQTELDAPQAYVTTTAKSAAAPVLWRVSRDGHVNVNAAEKLAALDAVVAWAEGGPPPAAGFDATLTVPAGKSAVEFAADNSAGHGRVTAIHPVYGNLTLDFQPADLARMGIGPEDSFALDAGGKTFRVVYGRTFGSVPHGDWVGFPDPDGRVTVAINRGNAATTAGLKVGDPVTLRPLRQ